MNNLTHEDFVKKIYTLFNTALFAIESDLGELNVAISVAVANSGATQRDHDKLLVMIYHKTMSIIKDSGKISLDDSKKLISIIYVYEITRGTTCAFHRLGYDQVNQTMGPSGSMNLSPDECPELRSEIYMPDGSAVPGFDDENLFKMLIEMKSPFLVRQKMHVKMLELTSMI